MAGQMIRVVIHQLEKALDACRGVVRALALIPMRQHEHDARALAPPFLSCAARPKGVCPLAEAGGCFAMAARVADGAGLA